MQAFVLARRHLLPEGPNNERLRVFFSKKEHWTPACEDEFFTLSASRYSEDTVLWCEGVRAVATRAREGCALARRVCLLSLAPAPLAQLHRPCSARLLLSAALCSCCATAASSSPAVVFFFLYQNLDVLRSKQKRLRYVAGLFYLKRIHC